MVRSRTMIGASAVAIVAHAPLGLPDLQVDDRQDGRCHDNAHDTRDHRRGGGLPHRGSAASTLHAAHATSEGDDDPVDGALDESLSTILNGERLLELVE